MGNRGYVARAAGESQLRPRRGVSKLFLVRSGRPSGEQLGERFGEQFGGCSSELRPNTLYPTGTLLSNFSPLRGSAGLTRDIA